MLEWADELRALVRELKDIDVYFAMRVANWSRAQGFEFAAGHDFLGGDFYGGRDEQLDVCKFMLNLSERRPIEFMATVTSNLTAHESLKSQEEHDLLAFAAIAHNHAELAERGAMSRSTCWRRLNELQEAGVIERRVALLDARAVGLSLFAMTWVTMQEHKTRFGKPLKHFFSVYPRCWKPIQPPETGITCSSSPRATWTPMIGS
jgi:hypothetical protein